MNKLFTYLIISALFTLSLHAQYDNTAAENLGWRLGSQAYTFKKFTFVETLDKLNELGLNYVEMYRGQKIGEGDDNTTHFTMDEATREKIKSLLQSKGITVVNYGVVRAKDEAEWRKIFDFAKDMGIETLTAEPDADQLDMMEKLADEYQINVAIHNHPVPSYWWHPEIVLRALDGRSERLGVCADFGHWARSGLDPVECVQMLEGKIISAHIKDLNVFGVRSAHDVPWGTGVCNIPGLLHELKKQGFKGTFSIEYEHNWDNSLPEIKESVDYFNRVAHWISN